MLIGAAAGMLVAMAAGVATTLGLRAAQLAFSYVPTLP
jgi:hypothetical protein